MRKAIDLRQSESSAFPQTFCREKRLKYSRQDVGCDADAGIRHSHCHEVSLELIHSVGFLQCDVPHRQRYGAAARHGVTCIDHDVDQRQFKFRDVDLDRPELGRNVALKLNVSAQRTNQHFMNGVDAFLEIGHDRVEWLTPRESQQLTRQALAAISGCVDRVDSLQVLGIGEPKAQELRVPANDHQQIGEIVGNASRELTERFHFLRLGELLLRALERHLRLPSLAVVAHDVHEADELTGLIADRFDHHTRPELALVTPYTQSFDGTFALIGGDLEGSRRLAVLLLLVGMESTEVLSDDFHGRVLQNALSTRVPVGDVAIRVEHEHRVIGDALNKEPKAPFAFHERYLCLAALEDLVLKRGFDTFPLLALGLNDRAGLLEIHCALMERLPQLLVRTLQILLGIAAGGDILGDCHEVAHGTPLIDDGRDVAPDPYARAIRPRTLVLFFDHQTPPPTDCFVDKIGKAGAVVGVDQVLHPRLQQFRSWTLEDFAKSLIDGSETSCRIGLGDAHGRLID